MMIGFYNYEGTITYMVAEKGNNSSNYFTTEVDYGSCSYCDTLEGILESEVEETKLKDLITLSLHLVQRMKLSDEN